MIRWITIAKFAAETGYSEQAIRKKVNDRKWPDALWRKAPDGHILINTEEYEKWVEMGQESGPPVKRQSKSRSITRVSNAESGSQGSPQWRT